MVFTGTPSAWIWLAFIDADLTKECSLYRDSESPRWQLQMVLVGRQLKIIDSTVGYILYPLTVTNDIGPVWHFHSFFSVLFR